MTITYVAAGVAATGNNASVTPALPAGVAAGDLLLVVASIRNSGTGTVNTPTGWAQVATFGNLTVLGRWYATGVTAPTVTFAGGVSSADTIARMVAFRGVSPDALTASVSATQLNGSAQNIAFPALDVPGDAYALLMALWKQDDQTSLTTPSGWTAIGLTSTTTGDDASQALFYRIETAETDISSGSSTVTGGSSAISRALLLALKPAAAIAVNEQDVYPPRVQIVVTGLTIGDSLAIYRLVAGQRTLVRGATSDAVDDTAFVIVDAELPFGTPVTYVAVVEGAAEYTAGPDTYTLPGGNVVLSDAITGAAAEVVAQAIGDQSFDRNATRLRAGGRNIVVTGPAAPPSGSYVLYTETWSAYQNLRTLLENATQATVQMRQPGLSQVSGDPYEGVDAFLAVDSWTVSRFSQDGSDPRRLTTINYVETGGWAGAFTNAGFTYQQMNDFYASGTYSDVATDFDTYLDLAQADFS